MSITQPSAVALYFLHMFYEVHSGIIMIVTIYIRSSLYVQNTKVKDTTPAISGVHSAHPMHSTGSHET